jgi:hypothetical protein
LEVLLLAQVGFQLLRPGKSVNEGGTIVKPGTATVSKLSSRRRIRHKGLYRVLIKINDGAHPALHSPQSYVLPFSTINV